MLRFDDPHRPGLGIMTTRRKGSQIEDIHFFLCETCYLRLFPIPSRQAIPICPATRVYHAETPKQENSLPDML
jgi:hypothetical protein